MTVMIETATVSITAHAYSAASRCQFYSARQAPAVNMHSGALTKTATLWDRVSETVMYQTLASSKKETWSCFGEL